MAARRRTTRSFRRGPRNLIWASVAFDQVNVDNTPAIEGNIVEPSDWVSGIGQQSATLKRIRGYLSISKVASAVQGMYMAIYKSDEDTGVLSVNGVAAYTDEDILWTGGVVLPETPTGEGAAKTIIIDVKAQRKVLAGEDIRIALQAFVGNTIVMQVSGILRGLVDKG